ncbi:hypothetical protein FACS1894216_18590 [Synergistales bacterium]|nr:hypothetical protein FACS1894216_18590 [Synergistales bacterium]
MGVDFNDMAQTPEGRAAAIAGIKAQLAAQRAENVKVNQASHTVLDNVSRETSFDFLELIPFDNEEELPAFPVDALPSQTAEFAFAASESVQAPLDMIGAVILGVLEIACRGRYPVRLPNGHTERPCLYVAAIAPPSERKSGVIDVLTSPLIEYEVWYNEQHGGEVNQSRSERRLLEGRIAQAEKTAISEKSAEKRRDAERELLSLNNELAELASVEPLRLYGADCTPEKLAAMLKAQRGAFALVSAEGGGLFENIGRYCDRGGLELYLNGYSGDRVLIDRKNSDSVVINKPTMSIIAPCQPSVIDDLFSDRQKAGRGLLSRILFVKCQSRVGDRKPVSGALNWRMEQNFKTLCHAMLCAESTGDITFDDDGFTVYCDFFNRIEPMLSPDGGEFAFMGDWAGKLVGTMTRLAGLIHCISAFEADSDPLDTQINADEARAAIEFADFFLAHAKAVYGEQGEPQEVGYARYLWKRLKAFGKSGVSRSEIYVATKNKRGFNLDAALDELKRRGYVRTENLRREGADKPTTMIFVNT